MLDVWSTVVLSLLGSDGKVDGFVRKIVLLEVFKVWSSAGTTDLRVNSASVVE